MDRANWTRSRCAFGARSVIVMFVLLALPFLDSCSRPASPQEQPKASKAAVMAVQSAPPQPTPQAQTPAAVPFAVLAPTRGEVAIPADAHRLDDLLQSGHSLSISALSFSRDGKWLASGGLDRSIILWNASTGEQTWKWTSQNTDVTELVFSPDCKTLVSADGGGIVRGWRFESAQPEYTLDLHKFIRVLAYSADGRSWAVVVDAEDEAANAQIELHDAESGKLLRTLDTEFKRDFCGVERCPVFIMIGVVISCHLIWWPRPANSSTIHLGRSNSICLDTLQPTNVIPRQLLEGAIEFSNKALPMPSHQL